MFALRATYAQAHAVGLSRGEYTADGTQVRAELVFAGQELVAMLPGLDTDRDRALSSDEVDAGHGALSDWIRRGVVLRIADGPCLGGLARAAATEQDGVALAVRFQCPRNAVTFSVRLDLLAELSPGHRHLATATSPSGVERSVLYASRPELEPATPITGTDPYGVVPSLFRLGVEHILTGYDHLLFLLAVLLIGGPLRSVLAIVTAFTLAHSVTLAVAALGIWAPQPTLVEPAIALSIAYVGVENCIARDLRRWRLAFLFGLVHGFGFAGALREVAVSAAQLPFALAAFNVGVEAGQLAVLIVVLPVVWWLAGREWFARGGLQTASIAISTIGVAWFVVRITGG
jgi:hydrogenase/urease accessory protein HupE